MSDSGLCELGVDLASETYLMQLEKVNWEHFTKGHFIELSLHASHTRTPWKDVTDSLARMYGQDWSQMSPCVLSICATGISTAPRWLF